MLGGGAHYKLTLGSCRPVGRPVGDESLRRSRAFGHGVVPGQIGLAAAGVVQTGHLGAARGKTPPILIVGSCRAPVHSGSLDAVDCLPVCVFLQTELQSRRTHVFAMKDNLDLWRHISPVTKQGERLTWIWQWRTILWKSFLVRSPVGCLYKTLAAATSSSMAHCVCLSVRSIHKNSPTLCQPQFTPQEAKLCHGGQAFVSVCVCLCVGVNAWTCGCMHNLVAAVCTCCVLRQKVWKHLETGFWGRKVKTGGNTFFSTFLSSVWGPNNMAHTVPHWSAEENSCYHGYFCNNDTYNMIFM